MLYYNIVIYYIVRCFLCHVFVFFFRLSMIERRHHYRKDCCRRHPSHADATRGVRQVDETVSVRRGKVKVHRNVSRKKISRIARNLISKLLKKKRQKTRKVELYAIYANA